jgi:hypothetical protein
MLMHGASFPLRAVQWTGVSSSQNDPDFQLRFHRGDKRSPFGRGAEDGSAIRVFRVADHDHTRTSRSNFNTLAVAQAVTGLTPVRLNQTGFRQQHAPSHHFLVHEWKCAETRQCVSANGASVATRRSRSSQARRTRSSGPEPARVQLAVRTESSYMRLTSSINSADCRGLSAIWLRCSNTSWYRAMSSGRSR